MPAVIDLPAIPDEPGSYQFKDRGGRVLYVGKAKRLRARLASYARGDVEARTGRMLAEADRVDWVVVADETEALLLEARLIARHQPPYNVRLRHDDTYPRIELTDRDPARVKITRRAGSGRTFGPFPGAGEARLLTDAVARAWGVRPCADRKLAYHQKLGRPCLIAQIGRCAAPCVDRDGYDERVAGATRLLAGDGRATVSRLREAMRVASGAQRFEDAARLRDLVEGLERRSEARVVEGKGEDTDVWGVALDELGAAVQLLAVRRGAIVETPVLLVDAGVRGGNGDGELAVRDTSDRDSALERIDGPTVLARALIAHYRRTPVPGRIAVAFAPADVQVVQGGLQQLRDGRVAIWEPRRGRFVGLVEMAERNAAEALARARLARARDGDTRRLELSALADALELPEAPLRIECFDISHLAGHGTVAAMSVLEEGLPRRAEYRRWKLQEWGGDDYAAMREVLERRFAHIGRDERSGMGAAPGLLLIDGGPGQLAVAVEVLEALGLDVPVASLAKRLEELWRPGRDTPISLERDDPSLWLVQRARDEAHRTAIGYQRKIRAKPAHPLDKIAGLGPARRARLDATWANVGALKQATRAELDAQTWLPEPVRDTIWNTLHPDDGQGDRETDPMRATNSDMNGSDMNGVDGPSTPAR